MKKGQVIEGRIEQIEFPNKGVLWNEEGKKIIVKNTIPGQKVSCAVSKMRKGKWEGRLLEILEKSPLETKTPACPHFGICGGCTYQNLDYENQLKLKESQLRKLLSPVLAAAGQEFDLVFEGVKPSPKAFEYRNKMEFTFGDAKKDGPLTLGMHKRGSFYDIANVEGCRIVDEDYRRILTCVRSFWEEKKISYYHRMRHEGYLRHLLVRKAAKTGEILIDLVTSSQTAGFDEALLLEEMKERILSLDFVGIVVGILHTKNDSFADVIKNEGTNILYGQDFFYEELLGLKFKITPFSFFQTNSLGAEALYETVREYIASDGFLGNAVFDLYSGTGTIAQMLAPSAGKVIGVEIVGEAVEAARENAALNGLKNCEFIVGDVLKVIDCMEDKPELIVLDPPRDGIHPKALDKICRRNGVERMVYISCKPTSLVRDLEVLCRYGYEVVRMCGVDMFPGTYHVETCVLLSQRHIDDYIRVSVDLEPDDVTPAETKATYDMIKKYVLEQFRTKVSTLYIAQIKRKYGLELGENYNKPKNWGAKVPTCPAEKEKMIVAALRHFQMIS